jgi:hypothetical protein
LVFRPSYLLKFLLYFLFCLLASLLFYLLVFLLDFSISHLVFFIFLLSFLVFHSHLFLYLFIILTVHSNLVFIPPVFILFFLIDFFRRFLNSIIYYHQSFHLFYQYLFIPHFQWLPNSCYQVISTYQVLYYLLYFLHLVMINLNLLLYYRVIFHLFLLQF